MKKKIIMIGLVAGLAGAMVSMGATKQVIRMDETTVSETVSESTETAVESTEATVEGTEAEKDTEAAEEGAGAAAEDTGAAEEGSEAAGGNLEAAREPVKMWGQVLETAEGSFSFDRQFPEGGSEEVIVRIDPERTLVLNVDGYPAGEDAIKKGDTVYVYAGPAMTLSLPAQTTADMVITGLRQDDGVPEYVTAAGPLADDGQGGFLFKTPGGREFKVPADCVIIPYLTRQMVTLSDIQSGRLCLLWTGADGNVEKIVLFNE